MESVVLLDEAGNAIGTADKASVHNARTPLHLAFSCYVFDPAGRFLLTRRASTKKTFPGVWTNSCCGHPLPAEPLTGAVRRRLAAELGLTVAELTLILPDFRYTATMDGIAENEMCPVFRAVTATEPVPDPTEVEAYAWVDWTGFLAAVADGAQPISPWCAEQLAALGPDPSSWPAGSYADLPPAAIR
ncbi:isopentenyl-diphosphate Delta-isomerase [Fodinicola acaciae]|uniref:isopentenyl-diphosphate Delta-isomerase n=1 Tax=Fodinicola acaciae TaxID=2681555 RepID=UPI0013D28B83|nr:isopentenyl-diphosphate Delta-isomerase [Fodinicola acaciae]